MTATIETGRRSVPVWNETDLPDNLITEAPEIREIAYELNRWAENVRSAAGHSSLFDRAAYVAPDNVYEQMKMAQRAMENDDVVSSLAEVTEGLAFQTITWESENTDDADVFNQINRDLDLDSVVRRMWHEDFGCGQLVAATWWDRRSYTVRGRSTPDPEAPAPPDGRRKRGPKRRKRYDVVTPVAISVMDHQKFVPVGMSLFGRDRLAYIANRSEIDTWGRIQSGDLDPGSDPILETLLLGPYEPKGQERFDLARLGVDTSRLMACDPRYVWRYTATKPDYRRFAPIRLKSVFRLLDMKQQMMEADRVNLIGAANYILLVKKGNKELPAQQEEIDNLNANFKYVAKLPVIVSDHRLEIEIIAPKTDFTLNGDRYDTVDNAILHRLLGTISSSRHGIESGRGAGTVSVAGKATARSLENRRHMIARKLEREIAGRVCDHPANVGIFEDRPSLAYQPRHIEMGIDAALVQAIQQARTNGELSRATYLEELGFDEAIEAMRREYEDEMWPDTFHPIAVPFSSPALSGDNPQDGAAPGANGTPAKAPPAKKAAKAPGTGGRGSANGGGRPVGGGQSPRNSTRVNKQTGNGNPSTGSS